MGGISRIGVSLPKELLDRLDGLVWKLGFRNRSEAIRTAIEEFIDGRVLSQAALGEYTGEVLCVLGFLAEDEVAERVRERCGGSLLFEMKFRGRDNVIHVFVLKGAGREVWESVRRSKSMVGVRSMEVMLLPLEKP
ncbi:MAG: hypothetical protein DRN96_01695 [Thermoproteota archaeon]|nr:MAG: hypothetical protein DRN96_01695 [Candidatus Korarchaeota archaeon]RLG56194.1 MAG: hypothetical protein DRN99_00220 [Candidatus Korarchaeota archaeon]